MVIAWTSARQWTPCSAAGRKDGVHGLRYGLDYTIV
jgi:hypothetical protein